MQYAGYAWKFAPDVHHIWERVISGHYIAIADTQTDLYTVFNDQVIVRRVLPDEACSTIEPGPEIVFYEKLNSVEAREEFS